jgi:hypothetical protein
MATYDLASDWSLSSNPDGGGVDLRIRNTLGGTLNNQVTVSGSGNAVMLGSGNNQVSVTGTENTITLGTGHDTVTTGSNADLNTFILNGSKANVGLHGSKNMVFINSGTDTITDTPGATDSLLLKVGTTGGTADLSNFSLASGVVDLTGGLGFTSSQAMSDYVNSHSDGHGGSLLSYTGGHIDFLGIAPGNFHASNFSIA